MAELVPGFGKAPTNTVTGRTTGGGLQTETQQTGDNTALTNIRQQVKDIQSQIPGLTKSVQNVINSDTITSGTGGGMSAQGRNDQAQELERQSEQQQIAGERSFVRSLQNQVQQSNQRIEQLLGNQQTEAAQRREGLVGRLEESLGQLTGRAEALQEEREERGIPQDVQRLQDINEQIAQRSTEFDEAIREIEGQGRGIELSTVRGQQGLIRRQKAAEIGALSSVQQALQGNIGLSEDLARQAVNLEFQPVEQEIENIRTLLEINRADMTRAEERRAQQLEFQLAERERLLNQAKKERQDIINLAGQVAQRGGNPNEILNSGSVEEALQTATPTLQQPTEEERLAQRSQELEIQRKRQQLRAGEVDIETRREELRQLREAPQEGDTIVDFLRNAGAQTKTEGDAVTQTSTGETIDLQDLSGVPKERVEQAAATIARELPDAQSRDTALGALSTFRNAQTLIDLLDEGVGTGPVSGRLRSGLGIPLPFTESEIPLVPGSRSLGISGQEENEFSAASTAFTANFIKAISGAQVSDREREFLMGALPSENNQEDVNRANIKMLTEFLKNDVENRVGIDLDPLVPETGADEEEDENVKISDETKSYIDSLNI